MSAAQQRLSRQVAAFEVPDGYEAWTAAQKRDWIWKVLIARTLHEPTSLPPLQMPFQADPAREIAVVTRKDELRKALTRTSDLMEPGRPKVIHARGAVALVQLSIDPASPFTGLLAPGPDGGGFGLIRMSLVADVTAKAAFIPAMALKLLIDGKPSADVLAMNHTVGQGRDFDLFSNHMTNDLSEEHKELRAPQKLLSVLFDRVSHQPRRLVCDHLTGQCRDGSQVPNPVTPRRLIFHPTPEARRIFKGQAGVDFRLVLADVAQGTPLYEVEGVTDSGRVPVGMITTTTTFRSSDGGDRLFFRHVQDPADIKP